MSYLPKHDFIAQKMKFSIKDFFSKCDQIRFPRIWSHLLKKSIIENFIFCAIWSPFDGSCPRGKLPPIPKLTLTQPLTLTRSQFFSGAIVWLPPTLKRTLTLTGTPTLHGVQFSSGGNCPDISFDAASVIHFYILTKKTCSLERIYS